MEILGSKKSQIHLSLLKYLLQGILDYLNKKNIYFEWQAFEILQMCSIFGT